MNTIDIALKLVEDQLIFLTETTVGVLRQSSAHIIQSGGKRMRPRIALLAYSAVGGEEPASIAPLAAVMEMVHTASLVHDDINDRSDLRRGRPTVNARWGNTVALLTGDFIFTKCLDVLAGYDRRILKSVAQTCTALVEGETLQTINAENESLTEDVYLEIIRKKTASLFIGCAELGGIQGGGTDDLITALKNYGANVGMGFQIADDLLDLIGDEAVLGKPVAKDLSQHKMNLATILAFNSHLEQWKDILATNDMQVVAQYLNKIGAVSYARETAEKYAEQAVTALAILPPSKSKDELIKIAKISVDRNK